MGQITGGLRYSQYVRYYGHTKEKVCKSFLFTEKFHCVGKIKNTCLILFSHIFRIRIRFCLFHRKIINFTLLKCYCHFPFGFTVVL